MGKDLSKLGAFLSAFVLLLRVVLCPTISFNGMLKHQAAV